MPTCHRNHRRLGAQALFFLLAALSLVAGCQEKPAEPVYDNLFDPLNPSSTDPFNVKVLVNSTTIALSWSLPAQFDIPSYEILHSLDPAGPFSSVGVVEIEESYPPLVTSSFIYLNPEPTTAHYFLVLGQFADGSSTLVSNLVPVLAVAPPRVVTAEGSAFSATRYIDLQITVSSEEFLRIASVADFSDAQEVAVDAPGSPQTVAWDLDEAADNGEEKNIYVLAYSGAAYSDTAHVRLSTRFQPDFNPPGDPATLAVRILDLEIQDTGVLEMRFAASEAELADAAWMPGAPLYSGYELLDSLNPQVVYAEFAGDFGYNYTRQYTATPDDLTDVSFSLDLPAGGVTDEVDVTCLCSAVATQMRFAETPSFVGVPWQEYAESAVFTLTPAEGAKTVYAQFRNDWTESAILTAEVIYVAQPLDVAFTAPAEGDEVESGATLQLRGTSTAGSGAAVVDEVKVDTGDGAGFQPAAGTEEWTFWWDIPDEPTSVALRARAYAGEDSVTAVVNVTVIPGS